VVGYRGSWTANSALVTIDAIISENSSCSSRQKMERKVPHWVAAMADCFAHGLNAQHGTGGLTLALCVLFCETGHPNSRTIPN